jgi:RNA polymerase sigma-70 factor (ECF subfamily)
MSRAVETTSEDKLVERAQQGDRQAMEELVEKYQDKVYSFSLRLCGRGDADGLTQDTLLTMVRSLDGYQGRSSLSSWLFTIARNACIKRRRRKQPAPMKDNQEGELELHLMQGGPETEVEKGKMSQLLEGAIRDLDEKYRDVLVLRDVQGFSGQETADILGLSLAGVKSRLHRARSALRDAVGPALGYTAEPGEGELCREIGTAFSKNLEGDLSPTLCKEMESHLNECPSCKNSCNSLKRSLSLCQTLPDEEVPEHLKREIAEGLKRIFSAS